MDLARFLLKTDQVIRHHLRVGGWEVRNPVRYQGQSDIRDGVMVKLT